MYNKINDTKKSQSLCSSFLYKNAGLDIRYDKPYIDENRNQG